MQKELVNENISRTPGLYCWLLLPFAIVAIPTVSSQDSLADEHRQNGVASSATVANVESCQHCSPEMHSSRSDYRDVHTKALIQYVPLCHACKCAVHMGAAGG